MSKMSWTERTEGIAAGTDVGSEAVVVGAPFGSERIS